MLFRSPREYRTLGKNGFQVSEISMGAWALGGQWGELDEAVATVTVHAALYRLQTDYIDVLLCHQADPEDSDLFVESFEQLIERGLIRAYGVSTMNPGVIEKFDRMGNCGIVQIDYSIVRRGSEAGALKTCAERNIGTQIRGGLGQGVLKIGRAHV